MHHLPPNLIQSDLLLSAGDRRGRRREMSQSDLFSYKLIKAHKKYKKNSTQAVNRMMPF